MIKNYQREKLLNAIIYFAEKTSASKTKLFKLLFLLDFEHYRQTGRNVTGLDYKAWKLGPVPVALRREFSRPGEDLAASVSIKSTERGGHPALVAIPKKPFRAEIFSRRELSILSDLAQTYARCSAQEMVDITHEPGGPWYRTYDEEKGKNNVIPYELALDGQSDAEETRELKKEHEQFLSIYSL